MKWSVYLWVSLPNLHNCSQKSRCDLCSHITHLDQVLLKHNRKYGSHHPRGFHKVTAGTDKLHLQVGNISFSDDEMVQFIYKSSYFLGSCRDSLYPGAQHSDS